MIPAIRDFPIYCFQIPEVSVSSHARDPEFAEEVYRFLARMDRRGGIRGFFY